MSLTREILESNQIRQAVTQTGRAQTLSDADLQASIADMLKQRPSDQEVWIFAYGSLIWNPIIQYVDRRIGKIYGYHRRFCLWTPFGRGTPENRGLVLGLDHGGSCRGIVYRIAPADLVSELTLLWRREMIMGCYIPRWLKVIEGDRHQDAIAFIVNHHHRAYASNVTEEVIVEHLATAKGSLGTCAEYLQQTVLGLRSVGIKDKSLLHLQKQVQSRLASQS